MASTAWRVYVTTLNGSGDIAIAEVEMFVLGNGTDQCTGGTATALRDYSGNYPAPNAFDNNNASFWYDNQFYLGFSWIQYTFTEAKDIHSFSIRSRANNPTQAPKDFKLQSYNGSTWVDVLIPPSQTGWAAGGETRTFTLPILVASDLSLTYDMGGWSASQLTVPFDIRDYVHSDETLVFDIVPWVKSDTSFRFSNHAPVIYTEIRTLRRTGWITHDSDVRKQSRKLTLKLKRGTASDGEASLMVRWRDDGKSAFTSERWIKLGKTGETTFFVDLYGLGHYKSRQYEFVITGDVPLVLCGAEEDIQVAE